MFAYRPYISITRRDTLRSSRVQLVKPKSLREIYSSFVQTGEVPSVRNGGFDTSLDVPVRSFGDIDDASVFVSSLDSRLAEIKKEKEALDLELKEKQRAEIEKLYNELHSESVPSSEVSSSSIVSPEVGS